MVKLAVPALAALLSAALAAPLELKVSLKVGDQPLVMGQNYQNPAGNIYSVNLLRFYLSNVALVRRDGSEVKVDGLILAEFRPGGPVQDVTVMKAEVPAGDYAGVRFSVGVPRELNHMDAANQKAPLGVGSGMYWSWNAGYIFYRFEGKFMKGSTPTPFLIHMGGDALMQNVDLADLETYSTPVKVPAGGGSVRVTLDVAKLFSSGAGGEPYDLNVAKYTQVHGGPVALQAYTNLQGAWSLANRIQASAKPAIGGTVTVPENMALEKVVVWLCPAKDAMCLEPPLKVVRLSGYGRTANYSFTDLPPGRYAVWAFYDQDGDGIYKHGSNAPIAPYYQGSAVAMQMGNHTMLQPTLVTPPAQEINLEIK